MRIPAPLVMVIMTGVLWGCADTAAHLCNEPLHASVDGVFLYGGINGFLQIPAGGEPGTTSNKRPTFSELGIDTLPMGDLGGTFGLGNHSLFAGARLVRGSSAATLSETLISHGTTFPAGSRVSSDFRLDWYQIGYQYRFEYRYGETASVALVPAIDFALLSFGYDLAAPVDLTASRSFSKATPRLGLQTEWKPIPPAAISAGVMGSLPISNTPSILSLNLTGRYDVWTWGHYRVTALLGLAYDTVNFEDSQQVPNRIHAEIGPALEAGLELHWSQPSAPETDNALPPDAVGSLARSYIPR